MSITALAMPPQDDKTQKKKQSVAKAQPVLQVEDETIPDSHRLSTCDSQRMSGSRWSMTIR